MKRAECCLCKKRIELNEPRTCPLVYSVRPYFFQYVINVFLQYQGYTVHHVICQKCKAKVMRPKMRGLEPVAATWFKNNTGLPAPRPYRKRSEPEILKDQ